MNQRPAAPSITTLKQLILDTITSRSWTYQNGGGNETRLQWRSGCGQRQHLTGMALDIILYSRDFRQKILAHNLFALFARRQRIMGWRTLIYEDVCLVARGGTLEVQTYFDTERRHYTHLHIDWYRHDPRETEIVTHTPESLNTSFSETLQRDMTELNRAFVNNQLSPLDLRQVPLGVYLFENAQP